MKLLTNFPVYEGCLDEYGGAAGLSNDCAELELDGLEIIWGDDDCAIDIIPPELVVGYHLTFFTTWVDLWQGNEAALLEEFDSWDNVRWCYGTESREGIVARYRKDLQRAIGLGAEYAVFHVSDEPMRDCFTGEKSHSDQEVCDCSIELVNELFDGVSTDIELLLENQWFAGLTFCDPKITQRLIDGIEYDKVGIMLDTGHLMHTNTRLRTQAEAARYIQECYDAHGPLRERVRGLHLHQSLTGDYVERTRGVIPPEFTGSYMERFAVCYRHVENIDLHEPWTDPIVADLVRHIGPKWVNNELLGGGRATRLAKLQTQLRALGGSAPEL